VRGLRLGLITSTDIGGSYSEGGCTFGAFAFGFRFS